MTTIAAPAGRRRSVPERVARWARRHPLLAYVLAIALGTLAAWACEYATGATSSALCRLRWMLQERLGEVIEQTLRRPLAP